jgi:ATP diphosphatase
VSDPQRSAEAVARLDAITRRLRRECPWDREQDERSIVPHTVEEAYELAEAAETGDDAKLLDELGDVLFQVHFLSLLLEEREAGDMAAVADHCREKLIRRHPHVFGPTEQSSHHPGTPGRIRPEGGSPVADAPSEDVPGSDFSPALPRPGTVGAVEGITAGEVLQNWDRIKQQVEGRGDDGDPFADVPENLPALLYARKLQRRAASRAEGAGLSPSPLEAAGRAREALAELEALAAGGADAAPETDPETRSAIERALGEALFAAVDAARQLRCDPELALRAASSRYRHRTS